MKTISINDVGFRLAEQIKPGHLLVDGIVLAAERQDSSVRITFRNVVYLETVGTKLEILGAVDLDILRAVQASVREEGKL